MEKVIRSEEAVQDAVSMYISGSFSSREALAEGGIYPSTTDIFAKMADILSEVDRDVQAAWAADTTEGDVCEDADTLITTAANELIALDDESSLDF